MTKPLNQPEFRDSLFLFILVLLSAVLSIANLGFYSDDWSYLAALQQSSLAGIGAMSRSLLHADPGLLVRPVQLASLVIEFKAFGLRALPYHLVITAILAIVVVLVYLTERAVPCPRRISLAIAIVFGFLPQYSTDRFWLASQQAVACMMFALIGIYALIRYTSPAATHRVWWSACASVSFVLSLLSYEVALFLIVASILIIAWQSFAKRDRQSASALPGIIAAALPIMVLGLIKIHFQHRYVLHHRIPLFWLRPDIWKLAATHAFQFNLWTYGLHLPSVLASLHRHRALTSASVAASLAVAAFALLYLWRIHDESAFPTARSGLQLIAAGFVLFALGYALFSPLPGSDFESTGLSNRITIASALGASCVLVGLMILLSRSVKFSPVQPRLFAIFLSVVCGFYCLVIHGIAFYWADAASRQSAILQSVPADLNSLPAGSTILLDGFCPYSGPAVVFETDWDATGALQLTRADSTVTSDVVSKNMEFNDDAVDSTIYQSHEGHYPYSHQLFVYNTQARLLISLPSRNAAAEYLHKFHPSGDNACPEARAGEGVPIF